jgi:hypothetical protein
MSKQQQIADELGVHRTTLYRDGCKNSVRTEKTQQQPRTYSRYTINR